MRREFRPVNTEPGARRARALRPVNTGPARGGPTPSGRSTRARRAKGPRLPAGQHGARGDAETRRLFLKVGTPRGGTRLRVRALHVPPPPSDAVPPPSSPTRTFSPACVASFARAASLTHAASFARAAFPLSAISPFERGVDGPKERRARVPTPRYEAPRRREMRFHCVIILKGVAARDVTVSAGQGGAQ